MVGSASNRNELPDVSPGGKHGRCLGLTTFNILTGRLSRNSGSLNLLETEEGLFRPVQGFLHLYILLHKLYIYIHTYIHVCAHAHTNKHTHIKVKVTPEQVTKAQNGE